MIVMLEVIYDSQEKEMVYRKWEHYTMYWAF